MRAEERAAGLCFEGPGLEGTCEHETTGVACHDCILAAIRAAEREAADEALRGLRDTLASLVAKWREEANDAGGDYYAGQYDSHEECADEIEAALASTGGGR